FALVDLGQELAAYRRDVGGEELFDFRFRLRREGLRRFARFVAFLPEPQTKRVARGRGVFGREKVFDVRVDEDSRAVFVGVRVDHFAVGAFDLVRREKMRDACEIVVRADRDDERDVIGEAWIRSGEERDAAAEARSHETDRATSGSRTER